MVEKIVDLEEFQRSLLAPLVVNAALTVILDCETRNELSPEGKRMAEWCDWAILGGYELEQKEVEQKLRDYADLSDEELHEVVDANSGPAIERLVSYQLKSLEYLLLEPRDI